MITITAGAGELCFSTEDELRACLERLHRTGAVLIERTETPYAVYYKWYGVSIKISK